MVLYDHVIDWREDLANSRRNAFVDAALERRGFRPCGAVEREVAVAMLTTDLIERYFESIRANFESARLMAASLGVAGLVAHFDLLGREMAQQAIAINATHRELLSRTQKLLFPSHNDHAAVSGI